MSYAPAPAVAHPAPLRGPQGADPAAEAASVSKSSDGHFWAQGVVNGTQVRFLVDTGASTITLTPTDAQRLGLEPAGLTYNIPIRTANGDSLAARVTLASVSVAGARVSDVEAVVVNHGLPISLLGMSYLGRLSRFVATRDQMILQP